MKFLDLDREMDKLESKNPEYNNKFKLPESYQKGAKARWLLSQELSLQIDNIYFLNLCWKLIKLLSWFYSPKETRVEDINMAYEVKEAIELSGGLELLSKSNEKFNEVMKKYEKSYIDTMIDYSSGSMQKYFEKFRSYEKGKLPALNITDLVRKNVPEYLKMYKLLNIIVHKSFNGSQDTRDNMVEIMKIVKSISEDLAVKILDYMADKSEYNKNRMFTLLAMSFSGLYE